jgi:hypothetical protein
MILMSTTMVVMALGGPGLMLGSFSKVCHVHEIL